MRGLRGVGEVMSGLGVGGEVERGGLVAEDWSNGLGSLGLCR